MAMVLALLPCAAAAEEEAESTVTLGGVRYNLSSGTALGYAAAAASAVSGTIRIRSTVEDRPITAIAENAFRGCPNMTTLVIEEGIETVGKSAFENCSGLKRAELPDGLLSIEESAFMGCSGLTEAPLPETLTTLGARAFALSGLTRVSIPGDVKTVEESAFEGCRSLTDISIEDGVAAIGTGAFLGCAQTQKGQMRLVFPKTVTTVGANAFAECTNLVSVLFQEGSQASIKTHAFFKCSKLSTVSLPGTIADVDSSAFEAASALSVVHYGGARPAGDLPEGGLTVHYDTSSTVKLGRLPTCRLEGANTESIYCGECKKDVLTAEWPIAKLDHIEVEIPAVDATCTTYGKTAGVRCSECRTYIVAVAEIPPLDHGGDDDKTAATEETAATCTEAKKVTTTVTCKLCGEILSVETEEEGDPLGHTPKEDTTEEGEVTKEPTCTGPGEKTMRAECDRCGEAYGWTVEIEVDAENHTPGEPEYADIPDKMPGCGVPGTQVEMIKCTACGLELSREEVPVDALAHTPEKDSITEAEITREPTCTEKGERKMEARCALCGETYDWTEEIEAAGHTEGESGERIDKEPTCEEDGHKFTGEVLCMVCGELISKPGEAVIPALGHEPAEGTEETVTSTATCTEPGKETRTGTQCKNCGEAYSIEKNVPALGHTPGEPVETVVSASCTEPGKRTATTRCTVCEEVLDTQEAAIAARHSYGEWVITKEATAAESGSRERTCSVCGAKQTLEIPASGGGTDTPDTPDNPTPPDHPTNPSNPSDPSVPSKPETPSTRYYDIDLIKTSHGSLDASDDSAAAGERVTITAMPRSGYELDSLRVTKQGGGTVRLSGGSRNRYTFTMPASWVEVRATFTEIARSDSSWDTDTVQPAEPVVIRSVPQAPSAGQTFTDVPNTYWASGEIAWAVQMGYMSGRGGSFDPDGGVAGQELWMVLARLTGNRPANMEDARRWAVQTGFAEGGNPEAGVTRQQVVTALYRCAALLGGNTAGGASLTGFADGATVYANARGAMSWAVTNGIISGDVNGRLNPGGAVTRAQLAAFLYRFRQRLF